MDLLRQEKERREHDLDIENDQLRNNVVKLRAEMDAIMREFQGILDSKLGMELEIAAYRKLLEGEESRYIILLLWLTMQNIKHKLSLNLNIMCIHFHVSTREMCPWEKWIMNIKFNKHYNHDSIINTNKLTN